MSNALVKKPSQFFKVILSSTLEAKKLKIPDAFVQYLNGFPKKAVLQNRMGKLWRVKMSYTHDGVFFLNGWQKFVEDNPLEHGDFLVFQYNGDKKFDVLIFGKSACEKPEAGAYVGFDTEVKMEEEEEEKEKEEDEEDDIIDIDVDDDHGNNEYDEKDSEDSEYNEEEEKEEEYTEEGEPETTSFMHRGKKNFGNNGRTKKRAAKKARHRERANDILAGVEVRKYVQYQNPYFVLKVSEQRKDLLFVPSYVLKDFGLQLAEHVTFHDKLGGKWRGRVIRWKDGRTCIKGWRAVCRWNHLEKDDCCICEFPQTVGNKRDVIVVHIIRGDGSRNQPRTESN